MKKELFVSKYKNNVNPKRSKTIYTILIDYFCVFIFSFIFFVGVTNPVTNSLPIYQEAVDNIESDRTNLNEIVSKTGLMVYDKENNSLEDISVSTNQYILSLVKTSYYFFDVDYPSYNESGEKVTEKVDIKDTFFNIDGTSRTFPNDNLSYYYLYFKSNESSLNFYTYNNVDYSSNKLDFLFNKLLGYGFDTYKGRFITSDQFSSFFDSNKDDLKYDDYKDSICNYNILNLQTAQILNDYYLYVSDDLTSETKSFYNSFASLYQSATQFFINEVEANYSEFIDKVDVFNFHYATFVNSNTISLFISYFLGFSLFFIMFPLIFKEHRTLGMKVMKNVLIRTDEMEPTKINLLIKDLICLIFYASSLILTCLFMNLTSILTFNLAGGLNLLEIFIFLLLIGILSILYTLFSKSKIPLSLAGSNLELRQIDEFEAASSENEKINSIGIKDDGTNNSGK